MRRGFPLQLQLTFPCFPCHSHYRYIHSLKLRTTIHPSFYDPTVEPLTTVIIELSDELRTTSPPSDELRELGGLETSGGGGRGGREGVGYYKRFIEDSSCVAADQERGIKRHRKASQRCFTHIFKIRQKARAAILKMWVHFFFWVL